MHLLSHSDIQSIVAKSQKPMNKNRLAAVIPSKYKHKWLGAQQSRGRGILAFSVSINLLEIKAQVNIKYSYLL